MKGPRGSPRRLRALASLFVLAGAVFAEYLPGFSLYRHTADADLIVEVELPSGRLVSTIIGSWQGGALPELGPEALRHRPEGATRAFLFLREGKPLDEAGVAWIAKEGVDLLPDNWGWGISYPMGYRFPTPDEFRSAVRTATADRDAVEGIAKMRLGAERALAASRLLAKERPDVQWYVFDAHALRAHFDLDVTTPLGESATYVSELRAALAKALGDVTAQEAKALHSRIEALPPGPVRREHIELLAGQGSFELFRSCHETATEIEEWVTTARAMRHADATRADPLLFAEATLGRPERAWRLLGLLDPKDIGALDLASNLGRGLAAAEAGSEDASTLGYAVSRFLSRGRRPEDRPVLLALARSPHACRAQALTELRTWTGEDWDAADARWDRLLAPH